MRLNNKFYQINYAGLFGDVNYDGAFDILESIRTTGNAAPLESLQINLKEAQKEQ